MYGAKNADQYEGDLIIQKDDLIFIGKLMPGYSRSQNDLPAEEQNVWQIERVSYSEEELANEPGKLLCLTKRMYPNGSVNYSFAMSEALNYNYDYRH